MDWKKLLIHFLEEYRGFVILIFCLPAGFIFDLVYKSKKWLYQKAFSRPRFHDYKVNKIQYKVIIIFKLFI